MDITKEQLEDLYIKQGLTVRQCAEVVGLPTHGGIVWRLNKFGIKARPQLQVDKFILKYEADKQLTVAWANTQAN